MEYENAEHMERGRMLWKTEHETKIITDTFRIFRNKNSWHLMCDYVRVIGLVKAGVIDPRE